MAGTRTAPAFTAAPQFRDVTILMIDGSGDLWAEQVSVGVATAAADIEAWVAAYQAGTQASVYAIKETLWRQGAPLVSNAEFVQRGGGENGINMLYKNYVSGSTDSQRLIAPIPDVMVGDTDTVDTAATEYAALDSATQDILLTSAVLTSSQYTVRRERRNNTRTRG